MTQVLLIQLPIPKLNLGKKIGNIPLGGACLKQAAAALPHVNVEVLPEILASYMGDAALMDLILEKKPDLLGFTVYNWNVERSLYLCQQLKQRLGCRIVLGGPEVTPDNLLIRSHAVDEYVCGEGEQALVDLLNGVIAPKNACRSACSEKIFRTTPSPYLDNFLEPFAENLMLLETQRGCPYRCGYCFYNKARGSVSFKDPRLLLDGVQWAVDRKISEIYLLDPSLNARPDLKTVLKHIAVINRDRHVAINSEIRAESIDPKMADLFMQAGFTGFEIGLQTTNKKALSIMNRPTNLKKFIQGTRMLKERGIVPRIDLISGLPGDDLNGFRRSVEFVKENNLHYDVQVFPLSVLPGTSFRRHSEELGLSYEPAPPYTIIQTDTFSSEDIMRSFDYAESLFDLTFFPMPELNIAWKKHLAAPLTDIWVSLDSRRALARLFIDRIRPLETIEALSRFMTFPYQVYVNSSLKDERFILKCLNILTKNNPFSAFEIIFIEPETLPDVPAYLDHLALKRPHYLDNDLRFIHGNPGNRAALFTVVSKAQYPVFEGDMKRHIYLWNQNDLPEQKDIDSLADFDGILIDSPVRDEIASTWQDHFAPSVNDLPQISFSRLDLQERWISLTLGDEYLETVFWV
ncbi:MAG: radical SAM protein [Proteobacteria bacterium]|nr:radical SAM protein [Pseudomonadota bacterium]MBU1386451.1 radical SAM protein [Pseudomonadota bacterium]MBU1544562.1 radical SAM protein [Pseudomonadota bacterium]MBU2429711.1 radical SAM protein [Pseudomonadota bacterium]MBU2481227.1 radical SAM protein [Pseudomonadota bacterium]